MLAEKLDCQFLVLSIIDCEFKWMLTIMTLYLNYQFQIVYLIFHLY